MRTLGRFVVVLALPALIFRAVTAERPALGRPRPLPRRLPRGLARGARAGYRLARRSGLAGPAASFEAMGMSCANSGFIGYPALLLAMPAVADRALAMNVTVENLVILPLILFLAEAGSGSSTAPHPAAGRDQPDRDRPRRRPRAASSRARAFRCRRPADRAIELVARSSTAVSLLVIGGTLVGVPRRGAGTGRDRPRRRRQAPPPPARRRRRLRPRRLRRLRRRPRRSPAPAW